MATSQQNLSGFTAKNSKKFGKTKIAVLVSEWNDSVTESLYSGAVSTLKEYGVKAEHILRKNVPGSFELTLAAQFMAAKKDIDAVICLGCIIQGETRHFEFICQAVARGITEVGLKFSKPVIFGVLTPDNQQQALDRAGGKHGNKGDEAAVAALKMLYEFTL